MSKRNEEWVSLITPENERKIASPAYIKKLLGVEKTEADIWNLRNKNYILTQRILKLEKPYRQKEVINLLSQEEKPHNFTWLKNRISNLCFLDLEPLIENGSVSFKEKGGHRMFHLPTSSITHESRSTEVEE